jgi:hypothetical protein
MICLVMLLLANTVYLKHPTKEVSLPSKGAT